jgi:Tfp pilus assembly protein PilO
MTERDRRALWVGGVIVGGVLLLRGSPIVIASLAHRLEATRAERAQLAQVRRLIAEAPARQALMRERVRALVDLAPVLLGTGSVAEGAATLSGELNQLAMGHRLTLSRLDPQPDSAVGPFVAVTVQFQAETDITGLAGFLESVETGSRLLSLTDLAITADEQAAPVERLRIEGAVRGWVLPRREGT